VIKCIEATPEVISAYNVTGEDSWVLEIAVTDVTYVDRGDPQRCTRTRPGDDTSGVAGPAQWGALNESGPCLSMPLELEWACRPYAQLPPIVLYQALALRSCVFVVEQQCLYQDLDGLDPDALIVVGSVWRPDAAPEVVATARVLPPGARFTEPSIGRVCIAAARRRQGLGRALMEFAVLSTRVHHPHLAIRISAQGYLQAFYQSMGFEAVSPPYLEDGIPHVEMCLGACAAEGGPRVGS
jgi:ElaA protein